MESAYARHRRDSPTQKLPLSKLPYYIGAMYTAVLEINCYRKVRCGEEINLSIFSVLPP
jgi:hypothetical protein